MKKIASSIITLSLLASISIHAETKNISNQKIKDAQTKKLKRFFNGTIFRGDQTKLNKITNITTKAVKGSGGWTALFSVMEFSINGKSKTEPTTFFIKDKVIAEKIFNMETGESYHITMKPNLPDDVYSENRLIAGNEKAKNKVIIFSDPLCSYCRTVTPELYMAAKTYPDDIALYYYSFSATDTYSSSRYISSAIKLKRDIGDSDFIIKAYSIDVHPKIGVVGVFKAIKEQTKDKDMISSSELLNSDYNNFFERGKDMALRCGVRGTPSIFINGNYFIKIGVVEKLLGKERSNKVKSLLKNM